MVDDKLAAMQMDRADRQNNKSGFTLIELSMVLVIVGLLVGGVLVGRDLIAISELRSQAAQFSNYIISYNTFRQKYNCIPGDCPRATQFFGASDGFGNAITNGNGSGYIDTNTGAGYDMGVSWSASVEFQGAFHHIALAGLSEFIPSDIDNYQRGISRPKLIINKQASFFVGASYNFISPWGAVTNPNITPYRRGMNLIWAIECGDGDSMNIWDDHCGVFKAADLSWLDRKIDDGAPLSGKMLDYGGYGSNNNCLSGNDFNLSLSSNQCHAALVVD